MQAFVGRLEDEVLTFHMPLGCSYLLLLTELPLESPLAFREA
jgi:hypothetical protein